MHAMVAEQEVRAARDEASLFENRQKKIEGDTAQRHHHAEVRKEVQFGVEPRTAVAQFRGSRLVIGRRAVSGGGDPRIEQLQAVLSRTALGLRCEAGLVKYAI